MGNIVLRKQSNALRLWTEKENEQVRELFHEGYSDTEIGTKLKRSRGSIEQKRHQLGLRKAQQPHREFRINDPIAEYYPGWYKRLLKKKWQEQSTKS